MATCIRAGWSRHTCRSQRSSPKVCDQIAPTMKDRTGGYTRIIKTRDPSGRRRRTLDHRTRQVISRSERGPVNGRHDSSSLEPLQPKRGGRSTDPLVAARTPRSPNPPIRALGFPGRLRYERLAGAALRRQGARARRGRAARTARSAARPRPSDRATERRPFGPALRAARGPAIIAEIKRASPTLGLITRNFDAATIAASYERAGVDAISVLDESDHFLGDLANLQEARANSSRPILRKDFLTTRVSRSRSRPPTARTPCS